MLLFKVEKYEDFPETLEELLAIPSRNFNEEAETFQNVAFYQLLYYLNTKKLNTALETLTSITQGMDKYQSKINKARELAFYYNISILYFMLDDIDHALLWLSKILNHTKTVRRKDIQRFAEILQLFYHYKLNNFDLLYNLTSSVKRKISRWKKLTAFEELVILSLKALLAANSKKERLFQLSLF